MSYRKRVRVYTPRRGPPSVRVGPRQRQRGRYVPSAAMRVAMMTPLPAQRGYLRVGGYYGRYANGGELKFHDVAVTGTTVATTGDFLPTLGSLLVIPQGTTESTRVGRKLVVRNILWKGICIVEGASNISAADDTIRIILYLDKQTNGAIATTTTILQTAGYLSFRNLENAGRYKVLMDKSINMHGWGGSNATGEEVGRIRYPFSFYKKCSIPIEYSGTTGAIAEIRSNNLCVVVFSFKGTAAIESNLRIRFSDA